MPARIRLQMKGSPANRFYWLIVQSSKTSARSLPIERMGYWIPDNKGVYEDRSIVLNRPRLKYWLGTGAQPTKGVIKLLSHIGFLPKRPPPFGTETLYPRPQPEIKEAPPPSTLRDLGAANHLRAKVEAMEKAAQERKQSYIENAHQQFHTRNSQDLPTEARQFSEKYFFYLEKLKEVIPNTVQDRSEMFMKLINMFDVMEEDEITPKRLMDELGIEEEAAEKILDTYENILIPFTEADLDDFKQDLGKKHRGRELTEDTTFYVPSENPITPDPNYEDDDIDDYPLKLFDIKHPMRPNKKYGLRIIPNKPKQQSRKKSKFGGIEKFFNRAKDV